MIAVAQNFSYYQTATSGVSAGGGAVRRGVIIVFVLRAIGLMNRRVPGVSSALFKIPFTVRYPLNNGTVGLQDVLHLLRVVIWPTAVPSFANAAVVVNA